MTTLGFKIREKNPRVFFKTTSVRDFIMTWGCKCWSIFRGETLGILTGETLQIFVAAPLPRWKVELSASLPGKGPQWTTQGLVRWQGQRISTCNINASRFTCCSGQNKNISKENRPKLPDIHILMFIEWICFPS